MWPRNLCLVLVGLALSGCAGGWLGVGESEPPLPGERIAVMTFGKGLEADPGIAELEVRLPEPYTNAAWSQPGGGPNHALYHLALSDAPKIAWRRDIGLGFSSDRRVLAEPLVVGQRVYAMDARRTVSAFEVERGRNVWRTELPTEDERDGYYGGGIAYDTGRIFVTTGFAMVFALDAETGAVIWSRRLSAPMRAAPVVSGGRVFAITMDNQVHALAATDGGSQWNHRGIEEAAVLIGAASPAVAGSSVVVPYSSGEIFSLLAENGRVLWNDSLAAVNRTDPIADLAHIRGLPVIDRGLVLAVSHSGRMVAIDLRRGVRAWEADLGGVQMPWVAGDFVYVVTNDAQVVCLTRRAGRLRWVRQLERYGDPEDKEDPIQWFGPVLAGGRLILAGSNRRVVSLSPYTGEELGSTKLPGAPAVPPIVASNVLYFVTESADLVALR